MDKIEDIIYLLSCSANSIPANETRCEKIDWQYCFAVAKRHNLVPTIYVAIKDIKCIDISPWEAIYDWTVRKNMKFDTERTEIFKFMDQQNIWHMPLKGIILQNLYPQYGMRQMVDNDILFDQKYENQVDEYMKSRGYIVKPGSMHNEYNKKPMYNFELHKHLCKKWPKIKFYEYFSDFDNRLIKNGNLCKMSNEDFYLFQITHEFNHYLASGTGLRQLLDVYICLKYLEIDINYIEETCKKLDIAEFEKLNRKLALKLFSDPYKLPSLNNAETEKLKESISSTTGGTVNQHIAHKLELYTKNPKVFFSYFFPSLETMQNRGIIYAKHKIFVPIYWVRLYWSRLKGGNLKNYISAAKNYYKNK